MKRLGWTCVISMTVVVLAACNSPASSSSTPAASGDPTSSPAAPVVDAFNGTTWRNTFTCRDVTKTLEAAGLLKYRSHVLPIGDCEGPMHITFAFANGALTTTGQDGKANPPDPYQVINDHTFVSGFRRVTYRMQGKRLIFTDVRIISALYPYDPKIMPREHALLFSVWTTVPFERVG